MSKVFKGKSKNYVMFMSQSLVKRTKNICHAILRWKAKNSASKIPHVKKIKVEQQNICKQQRFKSREGKQKPNNMTKNEYICHVESKLRCDHAIQDLITEN